MMVDINITIGNMAINPDKPEEYVVEFIGFLTREQLNDILTKQKDRRVKVFVKESV